jgi:hypothetical protein
MRVKRPKIIGNLIVKLMMAGNYSVVNDIKNAPNKLIIQCDSYQHGMEIIEKLKNSKFGATFFT